VAYWHGFRCWLEMAANIITGCLVFLQEISGYTTILREVALQIKNDSECNSTYSNYGGITDTMICAGPSDGVKGACGVIEL